MNQVSPLPPSESADTATLPASSGQERLWFLHQWEANRIAYNLPAAFDLTGTLDLDALRESCLDVVRCHEVLRTTFLSEGGNLLQAIHEKAVCPFDVIDVSAFSEAEREASVAKSIRALVRHAFDLERGPLIRVVILRFSDQAHRLVINVHHIVFDGWSLDIFLRDLAAFYRARVTHEAAAHEPLPIQYGDYAAWQIDWLKSPAYSEQLAYWKEYLRELPEPLALPTDHAGASAQGTEGSDVFFQWPADLAAALPAFCRSEKVTPFMVLMAAFQALLHRYSRQEQFLVGTPVANRNRPELEDLIGFFVNTLVLRADLGGQPTFRELLRRVREEALGAFAHPDLPFEKLIEHLQPERRQNRNPLFRTMFVFQEESPVVPAFPGLEVRPRTVELDMAKFDLLLEFTAQDDGLRGCMSYSTELFERGTIDRLIQHLQSLLCGLLQAPDQAIAAVPFISSAERQQILSWGRGARTPYPADQTVHAIFEQRVAETPEALALVDGEHRLTYAELDTRANQFAHYLRKQGLGEGAYVGLLAHRYWPFIAGMLGILKIGGAYVPLDPRDPPARLAALREHLDGMLPEKLDVSGESREAGPKAGTATGAAYVMFTSGSTGEPKGVIVPHQGVTRLVCETDHATFDRKTVMMQASNLCFDASTFELWGALLHGGSLAFIRSDNLLDHDELAKDIARLGINTLFLTTSLFNQHVRQSPAMFAGLRCVVFGGEAADPSMINRVLEHGRPQQLVNGYGPTETTTFAVCQQIKEAAPSVPIGRPISNTDVFILDERQQPVPPGVTGEIYIGGPGVALGYLHRPELTAERFIATEFGRLYRTGDFGRWLADGTIDYQGRIDQQFKLRGFRIEPAEIEALLREHPAVAQCAVAAKMGSSGYKVPIAYFVRKPDHAPISDADFRQYLVANLPQTFVPYQWFWLDALPLTANGKLDVRALPEPSADANSMHEYVPPQNSVHSHLIEIWEEVFQRKPIGIRDNFFDLGGHSLLAAKIVALISERLGHRLSFGEFFGHPTIEKHALGLTGTQSPVRQTQFVAINPEGKKTPVFFFHGDFVGGGFFCKTLASVIGADRPFYALHPHGLQGDDVPLTIEAMAADRVRVIREIQPHGPYILGGYCNGSLTAYHTARILRAVGEEVPVLLMLYSDGSNARFRWLKRLTGIASVLRGEDEAAALSRFLHTRRRFRDREDMARFYLRAAADLIKHPSREKAAPFLRKAGRLFGAKATASPAGANGHNPPEVDTGVPRGPLSKPYANACRTFIPERYDAPVVLLWPREEKPRTPQGPAAGWKKICDQIEVVEVPGHHHSCISQNSNVVLVGEAMRKSIEQAESLLKRDVS